MSLCAPTAGARSATGRASRSSSSATPRARRGRDLGRGRGAGPDLRDRLGCACWPATPSTTPWRGPTVKRMRAAMEDEYELAELTEAPARPYEEMAADLDSLIETIQRPHLRTLLARLVDPPPRRARRTTRPPRPSTTTRPTATGHRALPVGGAGRERPGGRTFPRGIDRELAVTGALLHDIGKTQVYASVNGAIELTDTASCSARSCSATTWCAARSSASTGSQWRRPRACCTSS